MIVSSWIAQKWSKQTFMFYNTCTTTKGVPVRQVISLDFARIH
jgi:hypothetical protein